MRRLNKDEIYIIDKLINASPVSIKLLSPLDTCFVSKENDGDMGSLKIIYPINNLLEVNLISSQSQIDYLDKDGVLVNITLMIDENEHILREVDVFKTDFSSLIAPFDINNIVSVYQV